MCTRHWSSLVMVQSSLSSVQRSRTPVQCSRIGLALWRLIILPGRVITPVGPGKDTHGTPVPNSEKAVVARSGDQPVSSSSTHEMQKLCKQLSLIPALLDIKCN